MANNSCNREEQSKANWLLIVVGVAVMLFGLTVLDDPIMTFRGGVEMDLRPFDTPLAAVSIGIGGYFLWSALSSIKDDDIDTVACQKCGESINLKEFKGEKCPSCGNELPKCDD